MDPVTLALAKRFARENLPQTVLRLPGEAGNYVSTPHAIDLDVSDLEIIAHMGLTTWGDTSETILAKRTDAAGLAYQLVVASDKKFQFAARIGAVDRFALCVSDLIPFTDGVAYWIRFRRTAATGAFTFDYAASQLDEPTTWLPLGSDTGLTGAPDANEAGLEIGANREGASNLAAGVFHRVMLRSGIGGTLVADYRGAAPGARLLDQTGKLWTLNGSSWSSQVA